MLWWFNPTPCVYVCWEKSLLKRRSSCDEIFWACLISSGLTIMTFTSIPRKCRMKSEKRDVSCFGLRFRHNRSVILAEIKGKGESLIKLFCHITHMSDSRGISAHMFIAFVFRILTAYVWQDKTCLSHLYSVRISRRDRFPGFGELQHFSRHEFWIVRLWWGLGFGSGFPKVVSRRETIRSHRKTGSQSQSPTANIK